MEQQDRRRLTSSRSGAPGPGIIYHSVEAMKEAGMQPDGAQFVVRPDIQNALKDPKKWNAHWERVMCEETNGGMDFSPRAWYESEVEDYKLAKRQHPHLVDAVYGEYPSLFQGTLKLQISILQDVFTFGRIQGFDTKWLAADRSIRKEHVLLALSRTCASANNLHEARRLCPMELNLAYLAEDGTHFIGLLKAIIPQDLSSLPSTLRYFPHPDWDALRDFHEKSNPTDLEKLAYRRLLVLRTKLICHVIHTVFRSFLGLGVNDIQVLQPRTVRRELERDLGVKNTPPPGAQMVWLGCNSKICPNGLHGWGDIPKGKVLLRCKDCWEKQHREVKYCSRECQKADWKSAHKVVCGKPFDFDIAAELATSSNPTLPVVRANRIKFTPVIGPAKAGFERSISLNNQISELGCFTNSDYILMPTPESVFNPDNHVIFPNPELKKLFHVVREKALTTGDREAVAIMAHALCWWVSRENYSGPITVDVLANQIQIEFSFDEVKTAVLQMQERQIRDPHKRPIFLLQMDPTKWRQTVAPYCKVKPIVFK
ncbi:MYND-type domain-containing protein [Mycena venus]|uniref:MYND-type domain-containing protein n=1 Tax=Mycena venus TaxID=2733690 RepID=A0A8H6YF26_9AGAR|nr:MYND-type domain-containing protein [Mycena venus]